MTQCSAPALRLSVNTSDQITNSGLTYDASGDETADGLYSYTWDAEGRMTSGAGVSYTYDGDLRRVKKSNGTLYWYCEACGQVLAESDSSGNITSEYTYFGDRRIARRDVCFYPKDFCGSSPQFISNSVIFTHTDGAGPQYFSLIRTDGTLLFKQDFPSSETFYCRKLFAGAYPARPSADGRRFALPIGKLHGGSALFDIGPNYTLKHVMVFDLPSGGWIARIDAKRWRVSSLWGLALSPDGSRVAFIDQNGILWLFQIPQELDGAQR